MSARDTTVSAAACGARSGSIGRGSLPLVVVVSAGLLRTRRCGAAVCSTMITATDKDVVKRLQERGKYRKKGGASGMLGMYPAGAAKLKPIKPRADFADGVRATRSGTRT